MLWSSARINLGDITVLFIIFINDLSDYIERALVVMYADDTVLYVSHESKKKIENDLNQDMQNLLSYFGKTIKRLKTLKRFFV